jgi:hypothetical protein
LIFGILLQKIGPQIINIFEKNRLWHPKIFHPSVIFIFYEQEYGKLSCTLCFTLDTLIPKTNFHK